MYVAAVDFDSVKAHQRKIVRSFAPHLSNAVLRTQEWRYFILSVTRVMIVFLLPAATIYYQRQGLMDIPVFGVIAVICMVELVLAFYRYFVLWPEGLRKRWEYWHEIEMSEDCYQLKIMGYYHRKIDKFLGNFPMSMSSVDIKRYYRRRSIFLLLLFSAAYLISVVLLLQSNEDTSTLQIWILFIMSLTSGLVVLRFVKMHLIELPQVLALRAHPEFATDLMPTTAEAIPFARPVPNYRSSGPTIASIVEVDVEKDSPIARDYPNVRLLSGLHFGNAFCGGNGTKPTLAVSADTKDNLFTLSLWLERGRETAKKVLLLSMGARHRPYDGIDTAWEERQFQIFTQQQQNQHSEYTQFLIGRLLEEDLHVSCRPMLPENMVDLHGVTIQGVCVLQIVDIVNIGASYEHRTEDTKGPTRTLKICFTDGHQLAFGFEFRWLPNFNVTIPRGTKVVVHNVDIRHGMLLLTPRNCQLLGLSGNTALELAGKSATVHNSTAFRTGGAYSAALITTQFAAGSSNHATPAAGGASASLRPSPPVPTIVPTKPPMAVTTLPPAHPALQERSLSSTVPPPTAATVPLMTKSVPAQLPINKMTPSVFVDVVSSGEDCDSDETDPTVEHLFYSPNTPRLVASPKQNKVSKKRPRPLDGNTSENVLDRNQRKNAALNNLRTEIQADDDSEDLEANGFALLSTTDIAQSTAAHFVDPSYPFQYFNARLKHLSAGEENATPYGSSKMIVIRAFIKSVAGFQFNSGYYQLQVLVEDCTQTKTVTVDPTFVEHLMGVSCPEFMQAMQKTPPVAHRWAAQMQFALMTLEGVMEFRQESSGALTLLNCRDFKVEDAKGLLQRVKASISK